MLPTDAKNIVPAGLGHMNDGNIYGSCVPGLAITKNGLNVNDVIMMHGKSKGEN